MKKIYNKILFAFLFLSLVFKTAPSYSYDFNLADKLPKFKTSIFKIDNKINNEKEVKKVLKAYLNAAKSKDTKKIISFYDKDYKNGDGLNVKDVEDMFNKTFSSYENIKYKTKVNNVMAYDNWALVQMSDNMEAIIYNEENQKDKNKAGNLIGKSLYNMYLKKIDNEWKISKEDILMEETTLKYGIAKDINMELITPTFIKNNESYDISLKIDKPDEIFALASITKEEIIYPPKENEEKYRKVPDDSDLERIFKANNKNLNEYGIASIGFTKVSVNDDETKAKIEVLGMAYLMKRINQEKNITTKKDDKKGNL